MRYIVTLICVLFLNQPVQGKLRTFVLGGEERSWEKGGYAPGGVIDFNREPGWIWVKQVDPNENIALGTYKRGGKVISPNTQPSTFSISWDEYDRRLKGIVSGDHEVAFEAWKKLLKPVGFIIQIDLGARFGVDKIRFYPRHSDKHPYGEYALKSFELSICDGSPENMVEGRPIYRVVRREDNYVAPDTLEPWDVVVHIPLQYVRFIQIVSLKPRGWEIDEVEVYGKGYVPEAAYESKVIDVKELTGEDLGVWGKIWWAQNKDGDPSKSQILVRTRTGTDDTPMIYYRVLKPGEEDTLRVSERDYFQLDPEKQGPIIYRGKEIREEEVYLLKERSPDEAAKVKFYRRMYPGDEVPFDEKHRPLTKEAWEKLKLEYRGTPRPDYEHWSPWSPPYNYEEMLREGGVPIVSPAPRRYIQIRVDFLSKSLDAAGAVDSIGFTFSAPPAAHRLVGEVAVLKEGNVPSFTAEAGEVERFLYSVLAEIKGRDEGFDKLKVETPTKIDSVEEVRIDGKEVPRDRWSWEATPDYFVVRFPRVRKDSSLLQVVFRGTVLRYGTTFRAWATVEGSGDIPQEVEPGDATPEVPTNSLSVRTALGKGFIASLRASPNPFTPNGDGTNDLAYISYNLLQVTKDVPVSVRVYAPSGEVVRSLMEGSQASKVYRMSWDGRDDDGERVPPGVYLVVVQVSTDSGTERAVCTVSVVY